MNIVATTQGQHFSNIRLKWDAGDVYRWFIYNKKVADVQAHNIILTT